MNNEQLIYWLTGALEFTDVENISEAAAKGILRTLKAELGLDDVTQAVKLAEITKQNSKDNESDGNNYRKSTESVQDEFMKKIFGDKFPPPEPKCPDLSKLYEQYPVGPSKNTFFLEAGKLPNFLKDLNDILRYRTDRPGDDPAAPKVS